MLQAVEDKEQVFADALKASKCRLDQRNISVEQQQAMEGVAYRCCRQSPVVFSEDNMHYAFRRDNSRLQRRLRSRQRQRKDPAATRLFQSTPRFGRSLLLYLHRDRVRTVRDGKPRTATSTFAQLLSSELHAQFNVALRPQRSCKDY